VMDFAPDARLGGTPHLPGTREYFTCLDGRVEIVVAGHRYDLDVGDVLAFPGNTLHSWILRARPAAFSGHPCQGWGLRRAKCAHHQL